MVRESKIYRIRGEISVAGPYPSLEAEVGDDTRFVYLKIGNEKTQVRIESLKDLLVCLGVK